MSMDEQDRTREARRRSNGQFGQKLHGEADFDVPQPTSETVTPTGYGFGASTALAHRQAAAVSGTVRNHARSVLGFVPRTDESVVDADARLAAEGRDRIGTVSGWDRDAYNQLAAAKVAETGHPLHPDDADDYELALSWPSDEDLDDYENGPADPDEAALRARYAAEASALLDRMPAMTPPF